MAHTTRRQFVQQAVLAAAAICGAMGQVSARQFATVCARSYVNQLGETSDALVRAAYGPNYARLVETKKKYDPKNVLRLHQNIQPNG
jgi:hypothetical protein